MKASPCEFLPLTCRISGSLAALAVLSAPIHAQAAPLAESMRASASAEGYLATESSQVLPAWTPSASLITGWGRFGGSGDVRDRWSIANRTTTHVLASLGIMGHAQIDMDLPMVVHQSGSSIESESTLQPAAFGDLRTSIKGTILHARRRGLGVGAGLDLYWPTGSSTALSSSGGVAVGINAMAEYKAYRGFSGALNLGYLARPDRDDANDPTGDLLTYRLAGRAPFGPHSQFAGITELDGGIHLKANARSPLMARAGLDWSFDSGVRLGIFAGGGLSTRIGTPDVQALLRIAFIPPGRLRKERAFVGAPRPSARALARRHDQRKQMAQRPKGFAPSEEDPDGDGLLASADRCPNVPEDLDRFADTDGCPESDNDRDGFADAMDLCPNEPEITNGYADRDGCPDQVSEQGARTVATFAEVDLFPKIEWVGTSARLTKASIGKLERFAELVRLNPWLAPVEIRVDGPSAAKLAKYEHLDRDDIALRRAKRLAKWILDSKIEPWRVFIASSRAKTPDAVQFVLHKTNRPTQSSLGGLAPVAAPPKFLQAKLAAPQPDAPKRYQAQGAPPPSQDSKDAKAKPSNAAPGQGTDKGNEKKAAKTGIKSSASPVSGRSTGSNAKRPPGAAKSSKKKTGSGPHAKP